MEAFLYMVLTGMLIYLAKVCFWKKIPKRTVKDWGKVNRCTDCGKQFGTTQRTTFTKLSLPILKWILLETWVEVDEKERIRLLRGKLPEVKVLCPFCADQLRQVIEEKKSSQSRRSKVFLIFIILIVLGGPIYLDYSWDERVIRKASVDGWVPVAINDSYVINPWNHIKCSVVAIWFMSPSGMVRRPDNIVFAPVLRIDRDEGQSISYQLFDCTKKRIAYISTKQLEAVDFTQIKWNSFEHGTPAAQFIEFVASRLSSIQKEDAVPHYNQGIAYEKKGNNRKALWAYNRAILRNPKFDMAYYKRGNVHEDYRDLDKAIADYTRAIEINPEFIMAYNSRGNTYERKNQYDKAIADYNRAIEINPDFAEVYNNRGKAYAKKKQYDKAIADYNRAIEINPDFASAYERRGSVYYYPKALYDRACSDWKRACELGVCRHYERAKSIGDCN